MPSELASVDLATVQGPVRDELAQVVSEMRRMIVADFPPVTEVNEHLLRMKGKMFRPTLLLLSAAATDAVRPDDVTLAAVVELIHLATLVHDDAVDHSVLRRGQPTVNAMFSHQVAVIMGDYLYSRAMIELVRLEQMIPLRVMSRVTNEMTVGEMRELQAYDSLDYSEDDYDTLIQSKTASLMAGACDMGARRADPDVRGHLRRYGEVLGRAFQITDDVLDYTETESVTGKPSCLDLREHKITLPLILARPRMAPRELTQVERLMADPEPADDLIAEIVASVRRVGGVDLARERAQGLALVAERELGGVPDGPARQALRGCLVYAVDRRS
ncbi:MAG: polyprenyl synthetase family protein [Gemmatimonadetes bacterium]|nr:polyprenyl synthetase family protein [Gemmatimonadota bacterium]